MEAMVEKKNGFWSIVLVVAAVVAGVVSVLTLFGRIRHDAEAEVEADATEADPMARYHRLVDDVLQPSPFAPAWVFDLHRKRLELGERALEAGLKAGSPEAFAIAGVHQYAHPELQDKYPRDPAMRSVLLQRLSYAWPNVGSMTADRRVQLVWAATRCHLYEGPEPTPQTVVACIEHSARIPDGLQDAVAGGPIVK